MSSQSLFQSLFRKKAIIGMVHLKALPGTPLYDRKSGLEGIIDSALRDAETLAAGGVDGIQVENQWDRPFLRSNRIGAETISCLTYAVSCISRLSSLPIGVTVHINGCTQALAVAKATGSRWIRAFELANGYISNSGYIEAAAPELMRYRTTIDAEDVMVFGDFHVKHGSHFITSDRSIYEEAHDVQTALADAAVVTGAATGTPPDRDICRELKKHITIPLLIGSGVSAKNLDSLWPHADGAIVGSAFKAGGDLSKPIDKHLVIEFVRKAREIEGAG